MAVFQQILLYEIIGGTLSMCQNTTMRVNGAWIKRYCVLCKNKKYNTSVGEKRRTHRTFPMASPKCLMADFTNLYGIYKAHKTNV